MDQEKTFSADGDIKYFTDYKGGRFEFPEAAIEFADVLSKNNKVYAHLFSNQTIELKASFEYVVNTDELYKDIRALLIGHTTVSGLNVLIDKEAVLNAYCRIAAYEGLNYVQAEAAVVRAITDHVVEVARNAYTLKEFRDSTVDEQPKPRNVSAIKKDLKHCKNHMQRVMLEQELQGAYKERRGNKK